MQLAPTTLKHPDETDYWRYIYQDVPAEPDMLMYDEQALRQKFNPRCAYILAESPYGGSDIRECMCGITVFIHADGKRNNWSDGTPHEHQQMALLNHQIADI